MHYDKHLLLLALSYQSASGKSKCQVMCRTNMFFNCFTLIHVSNRCFHIEFSGSILRIYRIVLSTKKTKHSFSFLIKKPIISRLIAVCQFPIQKSGMLKFIPRFDARKLLTNVCAIFFITEIKTIHSSFAAK